MLQKYILMLCLEENHFLKQEQDNAINAALNYGYAILLSAVNREISIVRLYYSARV